MANRKLLIVNELGVGMGLAIDWVSVDS